MSTRSALFGGHCAWRQCTGHVQGHCGSPSACRQVQQDQPSERACCWCWSPSQDCCLRCPPSCLPSGSLRGLFGCHGQSILPPWPRPLPHVPPWGSETRPGSPPAGSEPEPHLAASPETLNGSQGACALFWGEMEKTAPTPCHEKKVEPPVGYLGAQTFIQVQRTMRRAGFLWACGIAVDLETLRGKELGCAAQAGRRWPPSPALRTLAHQDFGTSFEF